MMNILLSIYIYGYIEPEYKHETQRYLFIPASKLLYVWAAYGIHLYAFPGSKRCISKLYFTVTYGKV